MWERIGKEPEKTIEWKGEAYHYVESDHEYLTDGVYKITDYWCSERGKWKRKTYWWSEDEGRTT